ncbi:MAG: DUF362 domain-containing protein [Pseudomonadota bacterium]
MIPSKKARVLVAEADYSDSLGRVIERIFQAFPLDVAGRTVLVKPNILAPHDPDKGVTTHPRVVEEVVRCLAGAGATVIVGDNPGVGGYGRAAQAAEVAGIVAAAGGCYENIGTDPVRVDLACPWVKKVTISRRVLTADLVVNLPKLKTHGLTVFTGAIKNTFGYVVGGDKMKVHSVAVTPRRFAEALVEIHRLRPPDLNIMDAVVAMESNGPSNGTPRHLNRILASDNAATLDAVCLHMLGVKRATVPTVDIAAKTGLGETDPAKIDIQGHLNPVPDFQFPSTYIPGMTGVLLNRLLSRRLACVPEVLAEKCVGCGICVAHCPEKVMTLKNKAAHPDPDRCISCYCCQELCPEDAIRLSGRWLRLLRGSLLRLKGKK